jgi:hypothetical protein
MPEQWLVHSPLRGRNGRVWMAAALSTPLPRRTGLLLGVGGVAGSGLPGKQPSCRIDVECAQREQTLLRAYQLT